MNYTSEEKAFWAMNANMAINNILNVIQYATSVEGNSEKLLDDPGVKNLCNNELFTWLADTKAKKYTRNRKVVSRLLKCLPVAKVYLQYTKCKKDKKDFNDPANTAAVHTMATDLDMEFPREEFINYLKACIFVLYELRNFFSHHEHEMYKLEYVSGDTKGTRSHLYFLYSLLTANLRTVKDRFYQDYENTESELFDPFRRYKGKSSDNELRENPAFRFKFFDENDEFTRQGLVFFLCQFLERKYASQMLQSPFAQLENKRRLSRAASPAEIDPQLLFRIYTVYSLHLPKPRLEVLKSQSPMARGMSILNELHRCPAELFELLTPTDQNQLRISVDDEQEILFRRHSDRFPYLALNYLDRENKLGSIRFQIDMGPYYFDSYTKTLLDGSAIDDRRLGKRIRTFCQIQEAERLYYEERKKNDSLYWIPVEGQTPPKAYRLDMIPQYLIKNNQIGIRFKRGRYLPPVLNGRKAKNEKPECWLSLNELPFLVFLVTQEKQKEAQDCITSYMNNWKAILTKVLNKEPVKWHSDDQFFQDYHIRSRDIPDELLYYFKHGDIKPFNATLRIKCIDELIEKAQRALTRLKTSKHDIKLGKDRLTSEPSGRVALHVIRELVQFQPSNEEKPHQGKVTSPNFNLLQALLATYNYSKGNLYDLFTRAGLIDNPAWPHPFLGKILKKNDSPVSLSQFYSQYLKCKIDYLQSCKKTNDINGPVHFLRQYDKRAQSKSDGNAFILAFAEKLREEPVNLPRGLFETSVRTVIKSKFPEQFQKDCPEDFQLQEHTRPKYNSTYLIGKFLEWSGDSPQWFYNSTRNPYCKRFRKLFMFLDETPLKQGNDNIRILKKNVDKKPLGCYPKAGKDRKPENKEDRAARKRDLQQYDDLEKNIRQTRIKDIILLEIARKLLPSMPETKLKLHRVIPKKFMLKDMETMEIRVDIPASSVSKDGSLTSFTLTGNMKIKNVGNLQRMTSDVRLFSFLRCWKEYRQSDTVTYAEMEKEFDVYDRNRVIIFQKLFGLEKAILTKYPNIPRQKDGNYVPFKDLLKQLTLSDDKVILLNIIRNAFAHHKYPEFELQEDKCEPLTVQFFQEMKVMPGHINQIKKLLVTKDTITEAIVEYAITLIDSILKPSPGK